MCLQHHVAGGDPGAVRQDERTRTLSVDDPKKAPRIGAESEGNAFRIAHARPLCFEERPNANWEDLPRS
jgi:hypothetical protein